MAAAAGTAAGLLIAVPALPAAAAPAAPVSATAPSAASAAGRPAAAALARRSGPAGVDARGAALADAGTGRRLWSRQVNVRRPIGSIAKVMTALVVLKAGHLNQEVTVTSGAVSYVSRNHASSAGLVAGDVLSVRQLLEALLVPSGCDAAYLLATVYGPGRTAFVKKMNVLARVMHLTSTHFANFDGLPWPTARSTYSTPGNLLRLGEAAMRYKDFRTIVAQRRYHIGATEFHHWYTWHTTDKLLAMYRGAVGIKTGTTNAAGDCLLFEARRGRHFLIGVVLHANPTNVVNSRYTAAKLLLNWGFRRNA